MAINPASQYPTKTNPADGDYPYGSARNVTVTGDGTGTPWEENLINDIFGFQQALLDKAGLTPTGTPETVNSSQYLEAIEDIIGVRVFDNVADAKADTTLGVGDRVKTWGYTSAGDGGGALYRVVAGGTGTDDGGSYHDMSNGNQLQLIVEMGIIFSEQFGILSNNSTDDSAQVRNLLSFASGYTVVFPINKTTIVSQEDSNSWCIHNQTSNVSISAYNHTFKCTAGELQIFKNTADNIKLIGLICEGPGTDGADLGAGLMQFNSSTDVHIEGTRTIGSDQDGLAVASCTDVKIIGHISDNDSKAGIYLNNSTNVEVRGCIVKDFGGHTVSGNTEGAGIQASGNTNCTIEGNIVDTGTGYGILCNQSGSNAPLRNIIDSNIVISATNPTNINSSSGIRCTNSASSKKCGTKIEGNIVSACGIYNFYVENHDGATVQDNVGIESERGNFVISTIDGCDVKGNTAWNTNTSNTSSQYAYMTINSASNVVFDEDNRAEALTSYATSYGSHGINDGAGGNTIKYSRDFAVREYTFTWEPNGGSAIATASSVTTTVSSTSASFGEYAMVSAPANLNGCQVTAHVQSSGNIQVVLSNLTGANRTFSGSPWSDSDAWKLRIYE